MSNEFFFLCFRLLRGNIEKQQVGYSREVMELAKATNYVYVEIVLFLGAMANPDALIPRTGLSRRAVRMFAAHLMSCPSSQKQQIELFMGHKKTEKLQIINE